MSFIVPTGWTRHEGFPQITGAESGVTLVDEFYATYDLTDIFTKLPPSDSLYDEQSVTPKLAELRLSAYQVVPTASKNHAIITLTYQPSSASVAPEEGISDYFLETNVIDKELEDAKTPENPTAYLVKWNYDLYEYSTSTSFTATVPAWWTSATIKDPSQASNAPKAGEYMWTQDIPSEGKDGKWYKIKDRTKPGVEGFIYPTPVIQERKHYKSKKTASTAASAVGKVETPDETYGKTNGQWLVMNASLQKDGRRYLVEKTYQWANKWDADLYADA